MSLRQTFAFFFLLALTWCDAQKKFDNGNALPADAVDAEKIYLQLTGKAFNTAEVVWFKAVVANAFNNTPSVVSGVLHVELIDPIDEQIIDRKVLKLENGMADSFFQLHANYPEGKYLIRAYTEWNKNFGTDFIFSAYIDVFHFERPEDKIDPIRNSTITKTPNTQKLSLSSLLFPNELNSLHKGKSTLYFNWKDGSDSITIKQKRDRPVPVEYEIASDIKVMNYRLKTGSKSYSKSIVLDENTGSLNFFPEGGALVNNIKSTLGFKYLNYAGKGIEIAGFVVDDEDNKLAEFKSNHLGLGKVALTPETGKSYFGVVESRNGVTYRYPIPVAEPEGTVMRIISRKRVKQIVLDSKPARTDSIFVKLHHRGKDIYLLRVLMKNGRFSIAFKNSRLPNGIVGATLFNSAYKPIAERHFYNHKPEAYLDIQMETQKSDYGIRDSVNVHLSAKKGKRPVRSSLSLMVVNKDYFEQTKRSQINITSYFALTSDIRGAIEQPAYYFEHEDHLMDLDYLLLTQGWTNYKYDIAQKPKLIQPEKELTLSGYVTGVQQAKKRKRFQKDTFNLSLMTFGDHINVYRQEIDSTGYFDFSLEQSYGDGKKMVIQPTSSSRKSATFRVNIKQRKIPEIAYNKEVVIAPVDRVIEKKIEERIIKNSTLDPYLLPNTIALNEVVVSDYELTPEREKMKNLHGLPDAVLKSAELLAKEKSWTGRLYPWLLFNYQRELSIRRVGETPGYLYAKIPGTDVTYILIDGIPVADYNFSLVPDIPLEAVKSVEIIRSASSANRYFYETFPDATGFSPKPQVPGILAIYTYSGKGLFGAFPKSSNLLLASAPEFSPKREFYSPPYDTPDYDSEVPDLRTLLYWKPNIITDAQGNATVKFFNGDIAGKVLIICEGIALEGDGLGHNEKAYDIVK